MIFVNGVDRLAATHLQLHCGGAENDPGYPCLCWDCLGNRPYCSIASELEMPKRAHASIIASLASCLLQGGPGLWHDEWSYFQEDRNKRLQGPIGSDRKTPLLGTRPGRCVLARRSQYRPVQLSKTIYGHRDSSVNCFVLPHIYPARSIQ